jgi:mannose-6-phosphate isomerase
VSRRAGTGPVLPEQAADFFRVDRVAAGAVLDAGFAVLVVTRGQGDLRQEGEGHDLPVRAGHTVLVPHQAGSLVIDGDLEALWCRPPQA